MPPSRTWTDEDLRNVVPASANVRNVLRNLGLAASGCSHRIVKKRILELKLDISHFDSLRKGVNYTLDEILVRNSPICRGSLKRRLLKEQLFEMCCAVCGLVTWRDVVLVLHLDHINGIRTDNRLENLRLICPNCDSLQPTYAGRNQIRIPCPECGHMISEAHKCFVCRTLKGGRCKDCGAKVHCKTLRCKKCQAKTQLGAKTKIDWPDTATLLKKLETTSYSALGRALGVSDNAIRKRIRHHPSVDDPGET